MQIFYVLAILGCDDGNQACQQARVETARYASVAECRAAIPAALLRNTDLDYPVIGASCQREGPQLASVSASGARP